MNTEKRNALVVELLPVVRNITVRFMDRYHISGGADFDDVYQWGVEGAIQAVERYEDTGVATLSTYASHRILGAIMDALRNCQILAHLGSCRAKGRNESRQIMCPREWWEPNSSIKNTASEVAHNELSSLLMDAISHLPTKMGQALTWRYFEGLSLAEIGERHGSSAAAAHHQCRRGLERLWGKATSWGYASAT